MASEENRIEKLEEKYSNLHTVVNILAVKVDNLVDELKEFKEEMRQKDNQSAEDIREIRQSLSTMQNQNVLVIIGVAAIAVAVFLK